jgi:hypothetical protein
MAQNTTINTTANAWVQLTDANIATITFQNVGSNHILIKATVGAVAPTSTAGSIRYNPGQGERNGALTDLFPGVAGANRVYAYATEVVPVVVSHA